MCKNIQTYFNSKSQKIENMQHKPIIMRWLQCSTMQPYLKIMDKKVGYLNKNNGQSKLNQWFLSDDRDFVNITAERYIIDYLRTKNNNVVDNISNNGVDAVIDNGQEQVGIEVTTLNGFFAEWIFIERLTELLDDSQFLTNKTLNINYCHQRIIEENRKENIYGYIKDLCEAITNNNADSLNKLAVSIDIENKNSGCIVWNHNKTEDFPWFKYLTCNLVSKLSENRKKKQLEKHSKNIVFVGVNHIGPTNWAIPLIFKEVGCGGTRYESAINTIESFWSLALQNYPNISGVCYFNYSLDSEEPFYPLRIFWRNEDEKISLNL